MNPTTFSTVRVAPGRSPAAIATTVDVPTRVRVRALTGNVFVATEVAALAGKSLAEAGASSEVFTIPFERAEDIMIADGDALYATSDGSPAQACVHIAPLLGKLNGEIPKIKLRTVTVGDQIREILQAPPQAPVSILLRSHGDLNQNIEVSEELMNLKDGNGGYVVPGTPTLNTKERFVLAPGQVLWAVARSAVPVRVSISRHSGLTEGSLVVT